LRSRWTTPATCAASRALATCRTIETISVTSKRPPLVELGAQVHAVDELHGDVRHAARVTLKSMPARCWDGAAARARRLAAEARDPFLARRELGLQRLDGQLAREPQMDGDVDLAHAARREDVDDCGTYCLELIASEERGRPVGIGVGSGSAADVDVTARGELPRRAKR